MDEGNVQSLRQDAASLPLAYTPSAFGGSMPAPAEPVQASEELVFLETGEEQAQKFIRAMSHQNASEVLQLLKEAGPMRLSDIAGRLGMSLNATKYHIGNLMDAGLLEISNTKYSVKGRKVKMYRMKNQIFIVAPSVTDKKQILSAVLKYGAFMGLYIVLAISFLAFIPFVAMAGSIPLSGSLLTGAAGSGAEAAGWMVALVMAAVITLLVMALFALMEYWKGRSAPAGS